MTTRLVFTVYNRSIAINNYATLRWGERLTRTLDIIRLYFPNVFFIFHMYIYIYRIIKILYTFRQLYFQIQNIVDILMPNERNVVSVWLGVGFVCYFCQNEFGLKGTRARKIVNFLYMQFADHPLPHTRRSKSIARTYTWNVHCFCKL